MIYRLSKPLRQLLAISLALFAIGVAGLFVIGPTLSRISELKEGIERERDVYGRLTAIADDQDGIRKLDARTEALRRAGVFIDGESEPIRLASLQSQLAEIIAANGIKPRSTRGLPRRERNDLRLVGAQLQIVAPVDKVQKILLDLEAHKPILLIDFLQITPSSLTGVANDDDAGLLDARFDVYAVERQKGD
ncbi:MAG: type II secretion system protein GspM [Hyphomicrobium sp.]|jgi:hypothetical protein